MEAVTAFTKTFRVTEPKTSTRELLPELTPSVEETLYQNVWISPDPSLLISRTDPLQQLLDFLKASTSMFRTAESLTGWLVKEGVRLRDMGRIQDYIIEFPDLIKVIPQAVRAAKKHLPEAQLILDVYRDPEIEDRYLIIYAKLPSYDERVVKRIEAAKAEFLNLLADAKGRLQLTTPLRQDWAGALKEYRDQYTALDLQKKALEWRGD